MNSAEQYVAGELEQAALAYAAQGMHVFPLAPQGKTPLTQHGLEDATTDPATIETWWSRWPEANVGIRTGDIVVVDEDSPGALLDLANELGETIPETRVATTASGFHFYFTQPDGERIRNTAGRLASGIDTRGDGGYVVAPPSIHPSGASYLWSAERDMVTLPDWIVRRLAKSKVERSPQPDILFSGTTPYGERAVKDEIANVWRAPEGTRNDTLNQAAFSLGQLVGGREVEHSDAWAALEAAARACGLPDVESSKTIRSGFNAGLEQPRSAPESMPAPNGRPALRAVPSPEPDSHDNEMPADDSWTPKDLNELPETPPVPPQLAGTGLVYPGKRHVFSGPPESAKTLAAYCILIQNARHGDRGLLLDFEMGPYDARQRLRELGATADEISKILYLEPDEPATADRVFALVAMKPTLVVIDASAGVYSLEGLDDNKRLDVEKIAALYIRMFWKAGIATILIDHVVKDLEARGRYSIGSERKLGGADVHLGFDVVKEISRGSTGKYKISTHKDRGGYLKRGYLADLNLSSDPDTHAITWSVSEPVVVTDEQGEMRPSIKMEQITKKLSGVTERLSFTKVYDLVGGNKKQCLRAFNLMIEEGYLDAEDGPRDSKLVLLTRPYSAAEDPLMRENEDPLVPSVPHWFSSSSGTGDQVTGSPVLHPLGGEPERNRCHPVAEQVEIDDQFQGWFDQQGKLYETPLEAPDDIDWSS